MSAPKLSCVLVQNPLPENGGGPPTEVDALWRMYPVADGDDRVEVVMQDVSVDVPRTLSLNLEEILPSCLIQPCLLICIL